MSSLQPVRGTHDVLPDEIRRHRHVCETGLRIAESYGYQEMATPIFEFSEVFSRTLGGASDIVTKEMYSFTDRSGGEITLRPEGTAGIVRALISGGLSQHLPLKVFYRGPMFRYERPQKGRLRQFHQVGVELLGVAEPIGDIEVIAMGAQFLAELGILEATTLELNSIGDAASRSAYRKALVDYLNAYRGELSKDSLARLERNPLRILDSKDKGDHKILEKAPLLPDYLNTQSAEIFAAVRAGLDRLGIAYRINPRLVRGLDYYCHAAFEFTSEMLGAQGTVLAGGRYDSLVATMGGPDTPGTGWAAGVDRIALMLGDVAPATRPIAIIPVGSEMEAEAMKLAHDLRREGFVVELGYRGNLSKRLKRANKLSAVAAILFGEDEMEKGSVTLRNLDTGEQESVALEALKDRLAVFR
ncbi:MAG: histidine--tRNA ligase [Rhodospirillaceae bacterium]|nr:MAG: histidine--tRNA ligase [Rhodospirillaceae bacterium]